MGYIAPPPTGIITLPRDMTYQDIVVLKESLGRRTGPPMVLGKGVRYDPPPFQTPRMWADLHVEALGYGLLAAVGALVLVAVSLVIR